MSPERFKAVLATLAIALPGREQSDALRDVYWRVLAGLTDEQLEAAAAKALRSCRFFPTPAELLELAQPRNLEAEAGRVFERVKALADYSPQCGPIWSETKIRLALGDAVADAYQAAGGSSAMMRGDEVWTRKAFVASYAEHPPEANPLLRLGSGETKTLPPVRDERVEGLKAVVGRPMPKLREPDETREGYIALVRERDNR